MKSKAPATSIKRIRTTLERFVERSTGPLFAEVTADEVADARAAAVAANAAGRHILVRMTGAFALVAAFPVMAMISSVISSDARNLPTVNVSTVLSFVACLAAVAWGVFAMRREWLSNLGDQVLALLAPLAGLSGNECKRALALVQTCSGARIVRDAVISRGDELRLFQLNGMGTMFANETAALNALNRQRVCKELHGIALGGLA